MPKIYIAGDSTASDKAENKRPETGWGECLGLFLREDYQIVNFAENGRSARSFIADGLLAKIDAKINAGDVLLVQFGHNDQKQDDPSRYAEAFGDYQAFLEQFVDLARSHDAKPIILSSVSRRQFQRAGKIDHADMGEYPAAAKALAANLGVGFIDMHSLSIALYEQLGEENAKSLFLYVEKGTNENYPEGIKDDTHFNRYGATVIAGLIAEQLAPIL